MTREELVDTICPSDNIADCCSGECLFGCDDCKITMGYMFDEYDKQIRADVIDEIKDGITEIQQILILFDINSAEKRREIIDMLEQLKEKFDGKMGNKF